MIPSDDRAQYAGASGHVLAWASFFFCRLLPVALLLVCLTVLVGWLVGDITPIFQWLSWVPAVAMIPITLLACLLSARGSRRGGVPLRLASWALFFFMLAWACGVDYGFLRSSEERVDDLVLVNWNATISPGEDSFEDALAHSNEALRLLAALESEVLVIFNGSYLRRGSEWKSFESTFSHVTRSAGAMILSAHEILEARPLLASNGTLVIKIRLRHQGEEMIIWGFDLPSSPSLSRRILFDSLQRKLGSLDQPPPDLLVGDFNVPRSSRSFHEAFPDFRNAFSEAGSGWSGTWPAFLPLWDLDQVLAGPGLSVIRYEVVASPVGMHRIQRVVLRR